MDKFLTNKQKVDDKDSEKNLEEPNYVEINLDELPADPAKRIKISEYQREPVNRVIMVFHKLNSRNEISGDGFTTSGFTNWKKKDRFQTHVGKHNSAHNQAWRKCQDLMNQNQSIPATFEKQSSDAKVQYRIRLGATVDCVRFLLRQGIAFRGHDESDDSSNRGNFLELLHFLADHNEQIKKVVLHNAPGNSKLIDHKILKDITYVASTEVTKAIVKDIGDGHFAILLDESHDVFTKEQVAVALRYVDGNGYVIERFIDLVHVNDTTALSLKIAIEDIFSRHGLSISQLRGQGYDGATNMRGEFNGLKSLILKENNSTYYVHCFAHQLQLALVIVAKNHFQVALLFNVVSNLMNIVGGSCKRRDVLRELQFKRIIDGLASMELMSGHGLNQETTLKRAGETRWGSHYGSLVNLVLMFSSVIDVLEIIVEDCVTAEQKGDAIALLQQVHSFTFACNLHLMKNVLGVTNELSQALQRKNQDIVNTMKLVQVCKDRFQAIRDGRYESLLVEVSTFCEKHDIVIPNIDDVFIASGRKRRNAQERTNMHYYKVELFYTVIDMQLQELNNRFDEANTTLLLCVACLNPSDSFAAFNKGDLVHLAELYPTDFSDFELIALENQLENYIIDMRSADEFSNLTTVGDVARKLVETKRDHVYPLVYKLVKLALILPVATASVEIVFSAMKIVKNRLRNRMGDDWMNDLLVTYIEKDLLDAVDNETIFRSFQNMRSRGEQL